MPLRDGTGPPWWHGKMKGCGYRLTIPRQAILDVLSKTSEHLSAEDIYLAVHKIYPAIGLTTVYRTLELLVQTGMVFKFDFGDRRARYELSEGPKSIGHHHHLVHNIINTVTYIDVVFSRILWHNCSQGGCICQGKAHITLYSQKKRGKN